MKMKKSHRAAWAALFGLVLNSSVGAGLSHAEALDLAGEEQLDALEMAMGSVRNPFKSEVEAVDPISKTKVDRVLLGPVYKAKSGRDFDFYRWVTFYNVEERKEQIYSLPVHREHCGEGSSMPFANYSFSYTYAAKVGVGINIEGLGLSADFTKTDTKTAGRHLTATGHTVMDHIPLKIKENWEGKTYLQTANSKTGQEAIQLQEKNGTPLWAKLMFPLLAHAREYPLPFKVEDAAWTFVIEHKLIQECEEKVPSKKKSSKKSSMRTISEIQ
jgi:hypothetical protein